ncbi:hypothetical protein [Brachybacterium sp. sponge]|uniref:hypothetical protein n=1 Tax=Brachybacterium sp. sponge TaxID=1775432 RepID=UPI0007A4FA50|nr:hypothetical protein [Brachybacterium sp. sponge]
MSTVSWSSPALRVWDEAVIEDWLDGSSAYLGGATPRVVIRRGRSAEVLAAIADDEVGVYG